MNGNRDLLETAQIGAGWPPIPPTQDDLPNSAKPKKSRVGTGKRLRLERSSQVRRELTRLYADMKSGELEVSKGAKLAYILTQLASLIEKEALESISDRLDAIERRPVR